MRESNPMGKTCPKPYKENAHMVWQSPDGRWTWYVLKTYQRPTLERENPYARWFCLVVSPFCPEGELGDVYVREIQNSARQVKP